MTDRDSSCRKVARSSGVAIFVLVVASCDPFVGEVSIKKQSGPPIVVVDPDYVIVRPVTTRRTEGAASAVVYGQTLYFQPAQRILDLNQLDLRTAAVEETSGPIRSHVVSITTTPGGAEALREWTSTHLNQQLGIFLDGHLISAPVVRSPISDMILLDGDFTEPQAEAVLARLRRGGSSS